MFLGYKRVQVCAACGVQSTGEPVVQCDTFELWFHPHCQTVRSYELCSLWECRRCIDVREPIARLAANYICPVTTVDAPWRAGVIEALQKGMQLEQRFWQEDVDNTVTLKSLACPFSADATEGPIGVVKSLSAANEGRREIGRAHV